jgi:hypothetical protein
VNSAIDSRLLWGWLRDPTGVPDGARPRYEGGPVEGDPELQPHFDHDLVLG